MKNLLKSLAYGLLIIIFPIGAGITIQVDNITDPTLVYAIQGAFFAMAALIGVLIYRKQKKVPYQGPATSQKEVLWFLPLIISEVVVLGGGIERGQNPLFYLILLAFTFFVGIAEEVYFRGIIFNILKEKGILYAVFASSVIFGLLHISNLLGGANTLYTVLQVLFAFLFGFVAAQLTFLQQSLLPVITWHFLHDFFAFITGNELDTRALIILAFQCIVLTAYAVYLNMQVKKAVA